jgi:nicotinamidase-related amidase
MSGPDPKELMGDPTKTALLIIDMQNDFVLSGRPIATPKGMTIVPTIAALAAQARSLRLPVIYTQEQHRADGSDFGIELCFEPPHCLEGSAGDDVVEDLEPQQGDVTIRRKRRYDAFLGTDLDQTLRLLGTQNLIVTGVCTDICVLATVAHARNLDYRCFVVEDGVAGTSEERHQAALLCMSHVFAYVGPAADITPRFGINVTKPVAAGLPGAIHTR